MLAIVIIGYVFLFIYDSMPLFKQKMGQDLWANAVIGVFSFTIAVLLSLGVKIPSPVGPIKEFITVIFGK